MNRYVRLSLAGWLLFSACKHKAEKITPQDAYRASHLSPWVNAGVGSFDISAPKGWQKLDTSLSGMTMKAVLSPDTSRHYRANLAVVTAPANGASLEKYFNANMEGISKSLSQYNLIDKGEQEIGGQPGLWMHFTGQTADNIALEQKMYVTINKGIAYLITCTSVKGLLKNDAVYFDQVLSSFKILK